MMFKLWSAFVFTVFMVVFGIVGFVLFNIGSMASDPTAIGNYFGEILRGFKETAQ